MPVERGPQYELTVLMRVSRETRDELRQLAQLTGTPQIAIVRDLVSRALRAALRRAQSPRGRAQHSPEVSPLQTELLLGVEAPEKANGAD